MNLPRIICLFTVAAFFSQSCDKISQPYIESKNDGDTGRKILLEEFTGHKCPNCPEATKIAHALEDLYPNQLILISIHAGNTAEPESSGYYTTDFRTSAGDDLYLHYGVNVIGVPIGMINRMEINNSHTFDKSLWGSIVDSLSNLEPDAQLTIINDYDDSTRVLETTVETEFLNTLTGPVNICLYIVEDSIVAAQKDKNIGDVLDYVHMNVLRGAIEGTWGKTLLTSTANPGKIYTREFSYTLDPIWNDKHCAVIAFIYYAQTKEIIQAEKRYIKD